MSDLPPHDLQAEQAVLGSILFEKTAIAEVADLLHPDDFYRTPHRIIFDAAQKLFKANEPIDIITIGAWLADNHPDEQTGGSPYLMDLVMNVSTAGAIKHHAQIVKTLAKRRELQKAGWAIAHSAQFQTAEETLALAQEKIMQIATDSEVKKDPSTAALVDKAIQQIEARFSQKDQVTGISTGFHEMDRFLRGLQKSKLIILAARPAMGKSGLALNIATNVAIKQQRPVLFYSLEMEPDEMMERVLLSVSESEGDMSKVFKAAEQIPDHLRIIDRPRLTPLQLRASIIKNQIELKEIGLVVVDYLGLMEGEGKSTYERVSNISKELKQISREFKVPLLCLAQLSREVEKRQDKHPMMSDLRDSGSIEQDADTVMLIYRDEYYNEHSDKRGIAEILVEKNRNAPKGKFELYFRPSVVKFLNPRGNYAAH